MIKTWLIPIVVSTIIMVSLLAVNLIVLPGSILTVDFLKLRAKLVLADSLVNDVFSSVENIAEASLHSSKGNFSEFKKTLTGEMDRFAAENLCDEEYFKECGILVRFTYTIEIQEEESAVKIISRIHVRDLDGFFTFERVHDTVKRQVSTAGNGSTG